MFDTQKSNVDFRSIDQFDSEKKKATGLILRHIDFHFVQLQFQTNLQSDTNIWKKTIDRHKIVSSILTCGTRFYTFFTT